MNKQKLNGNLLMVFFIVCTIMFSRQMANILDYYTNAKNTDNINTESTETIDTEYAQEQLLLESIATKLNIHKSSLHIVNGTEHIMYQTTSDKDYINTLTLMNESNLFNIIDNGTKNYTWYIIFNTRENKNE